MSNGGLELPPIELLHLLADGKVHSGQELAAQLGVSRTTIWKHLNRLAKFGLEVDSHAGKGYCLVGGLELLNRQLILDGLSSTAKAQVSDIKLLLTVDSTNAFLLREGNAEGITVCFAEHQTAGRGRRGREWVSPFAAHIYLSLKLSISTGVAALEGLSLAVGVVVARSLQELGVLGVQLKWPNDVLWEGKKLGGVLIEVVGDPSGVCHLVVGIGLNIKTLSSMNSLIDQPWIALDVMLPRELHRNRLITILLNNLVPLLSRYEMESFLPYKVEWESLNFHKNQRVNITMGAVTAQGIFRSVNDAGALVLDTDTGLKTYHGGEISLRGNK